MILWQIESEKGAWEIEVGKITVLKGSKVIWYRLIRLIEDYFINKSSDIKLYEDNKPFHKKDWECLFIPFDAHLQIDKINAKSPLKGILEQAVEEIARSPLFYELTDLWNDLSGDLLAVNQRLEKFNLDIHLRPFEQDDLKGFLSFMTYQQLGTPIEYKKLLLNLFADKVSDKKRLILLELPELYTTNIQLLDFWELVKRLSDKGYTFIIVTQETIEGNCNYLFNEEIITNAQIENIKLRVLNELPFICESDEIFNKAKDILLHAVDNFKFNGQKFMIPKINNEVIETVMFVLGYQIGIKPSIDTTGFSQHLTTYVNHYSQ